jgi:beta-glucanase (GH16 family)
MPAPDLPAMTRSVIRLLCLGGLIMAVAAASAAAGPLGQSGSWRLVFSDEFSGPGLDSSKWVRGFPWCTPSDCFSRTTPRTWYDPQNVRVQDGRLRLVATDRPIVVKERSYKWRAGMVSTAGFAGLPSYRRLFRYGYFEVAARVPKGKGLWPAIWLLPPEGKWPPEIDIMESLTGAGETTFDHHMHYHYKKNGLHVDDGAEWRSSVDLSHRVHVYGMSWTPEGIRWYVDGIERRPAFRVKSHITDQPMYLIINLHVGGFWPGDPNHSTPMPASFDIDYVRVWKRK